MERARTGVVLIFLLLPFAVGAQTAFDKTLQSLYRNSVPLMKPAELNTLLQHENNFILLDIRTQKEFNVSHLQGALFVDYGNYKMKDLERLDKHRKVVVYCSAGYRSERVGERMLRSGFTDVHNLYGGIIEWKNEGYAVVNKRGQPTDSVHVYNKNWSQWLLKGIKVYDR